MFERTKDLKSLGKHSDKERKDSLETHAELAAICTYVENQAILELYALMLKTKPY